MYKHKYDGRMFYLGHVSIKTEDHVIVQIINIETDLLNVHTN